VASRIVTTKTTSPNWNSFSAPSLGLYHLAVFQDFRKRYAFVIRPSPPGQNCSKPTHLGAHLVAHMQHLAEFSQIYKKKPSCNEFKPLTFIEIFTIAVKAFVMTH
jgi:hypothetical protein